MVIFTSSPMRMFSPSFLVRRSIIDLFAVHFHARRGVDAELHVIPLHLHDGDLHVITDADVFSELPCQEEHHRSLRGALSRSAGRRCRASRDSPSPPRW